MKLIEKKCPNCGANLSFSDTDKSCKCEYCKREFEIERNNNINTKNIGDNYDLIDPKIMKGISLTAGIVIILIAVISIFTIFTAFKFISGSLKNYDSFVKDVSSLSSEDIGDIDFNARAKISDNAEGKNDTSHSYSVSGTKIREKLIVAHKKGSNKIISIYKVPYHDFFHQELTFTVYVPVVYNNVKSDVTFSLGDVKIDAPEYYFDNEKTSYTYGYASYEEAYNNVVKPLEKEYKISEK